MLKLKLQYFGHLMWRTDSFGKTLMLGKIRGGRREDRWWDGWIASLTQWTWVWVCFKSWWWTGEPGVLQSMGSQRIGHDWPAELNWTEGQPPPWSYKKIILTSFQISMSPELPRSTMQRNSYSLTIMGHQIHKDSSKELHFGGITSLFFYAKTLNFFLIQRSRTSCHSLNILVHSLNMQRLTFQRHHSLNYIRLYN